LVLSRSYITKEYRTTYLLGQLLLPRMLEETEQFKNVWITCNENNKSIYDWFVMTASGKQPTLFNHWPKIYDRFEPIGMKEVYYTNQYVAQLRK